MKPIYLDYNATTPIDPEVAEATLVANDNPDAAIELLALRNALSKLPDDQREALILVGAGGLTYDEVAEICGCAIGTIKSRVSRARKALAEIMEKGSYDTRPDGVSALDAIDTILSEADELAGR